MASRRDGYLGIKFPGFFCPAGTYGMYGTEEDCNLIPFGILAQGSFLLFTDAPPWHQ